jgi:cell wall-associated NlpC family hydrolase
MPVLSIQEIYQAARDAGFAPHEAVTWTAIALAESGGRTNALADHGEHSEGLWQINVAGGVRSNSFGNLYDPEVNARAAFQISHHGTDMRPWTTTHDANKGTAHDYRHYLPKVEQLIGIQGDGRGVAGYGAPLPPPLHADDFDQIDTGRPLSAFDDPQTMGLGVTTAVDSDHDGLTDAFEKLVGTNPRMADTDSDGLSDGYEAVVSHTDPLAADTDHDHLTDPAELAAGSDPGHLEGIGGVVGSGPLAINVRNPGPDSDHDGIPDRIEELVGLDPHSADTDHDQLSDAMEISLGTDPTAADSDHDGLTDAFEVQNHLDPLAATGSATETVPRWTLSSALAERTANQQMVTGSAAGAAWDAPSDPASDPVSGGAQPADSGALQTFIDSAKAQAGDSYVYGATPSLANPDPRAFDCSSLTQWAAHQAGVKLPRIAEAQYMDLKSKDMLIPVDKAMHTPGALLFYFSEEPHGPLPAGQAHVAISLGNGKTIEAKGTAYGVGEFPAKGRFNYAGLVPGISDGSADPLASAGDQSLGGDAFSIDAPALNDAPTDDLPGVHGNDADHDHDGLTDAFEKLVGSDPLVADTDHDGISDGREAMITHTDPLAADTDHDHISDATELATGTDPGRIAGIGGVEGTGRLAENVRVPQTDSDHDGISDHIERLLGTNPNAADTDHDGLSDAMERAIGTNPLSADSDSDGLSDGLEVHFHTDPLVANELGPQAPEAGTAEAVNPTDAGTVFDHGW